LIRSGDAFVIGVGATPQGKQPESSGDDLAIRALRAALDDAGLSLSSIDGLAVQTSYRGGSLLEVGHRLSIAPNVSTSVSSHSQALTFATTMVADGRAQCVAILYGTNQRTNRNDFSPPTFHVGGNFARVYGLSSPASTSAFNFRRRMHDYGATEQQLAAIAVAQSKAASRNPLAVYRDVLTLDDYMAAPYLIEPLRRPDFSMVSDGGFAVLIGTAEMAARAKSTAVHVSAIAYAADYSELEHPDAMYHPTLKVTAERLWSAAPYRYEDIDALYVQDAFTPNVLAGLENYGFCKLGTAHEWIQGGTIELGGVLPVNVNGGQNRMTYMVGWQNTYDAVRQLRGTADSPERQVANCNVVMCTYSSGHWQESCALILDRPTTSLALIHGS
jgi:acetyl-CoA acetyltransferase